MWRPMQRTALLVTALGTLWLSVGTSGQSTPAPSTSNGEWPHYTGDLRGTKYSPLDQINASNFNKLEIAWRFKTDSLGTRPEYKLEGTPLMVGGVLYATGGTRRAVVALDAQSGELLWVHRYPEGPRGAWPNAKCCVEGPVFSVDEITLARDRNIEVREELFSRDYVLTADEAFFVGTGAEVTPIVELDRRMIGNGQRGPLTTLIQAAFFDAAHGRDPLHEEWLTLV